MTRSLDSSTRSARSSPVEGALRSFVDVFDAEYRQMVQIARLTTGSNVVAEDLVQDAFADLYRRFDGVRSPEAYLRRAVISRCTSWVRRRTTERRYLDRARPEPPATIGGDDPDVLAAVSALPIRQRTAIVLRYFADWSEADIAAALRCRPGTVKSLLSRSRARLSEELHDDH